MTDFHKLPFLLSGFMTMLVGIISYSSGAGSNNMIYLHMILTMVIFFLIGQFAEKTLEAIVTEVEKKKKDEENEENKNNESVIGRSINLSADGTAGSLAGSKNTVYTANGINTGLHNLNSDENRQNTAPAEEGQDDGFEPLTVSRVISGELKK